MIKIYVSCISCGINRLLVRKVTDDLTANDIEYVVYETKYDKVRRSQHGYLLKEAGITNDRYPAIVVDEADEVTRLSEFDNCEFC